MLRGCSSLINLPDIGKWNTSNCKFMHSLFGSYSSLNTLPDISKWNMKHIEFIEKMFYECSSLKKLPDITKWNLPKIFNMRNIISGCLSLTFVDYFSFGGIISYNFPSYDCINCINLTLK